jgi:hypothetical protein
MRHLHCDGCRVPVEGAPPTAAAVMYSGHPSPAATSRRSQHVDLAAMRGRVEAVLDQSANRQQASQRPPRADHVEVDVGADGARRKWPW